MSAYKTATGERHYLMASSEFDIGPNGSSQTNEQTDRRPGSLRNRKQDALLKARDDIRSPIVSTRAFVDVRERNLADHQHFLV